MAERVCCSYQNVLSIQNRVCCLYRVSTTKQVDHDDQNQADIPVQRKACREFAERMGWTIVYEEQENGVSGFKVSANDRDKIQLIKEYAEQQYHGNPLGGYNVYPAERNNHGKYHRIKYQSKNPEYDYVKGYWSRWLKIGDIGVDRIA